MCVYCCSWSDTEEEVVAVVVTGDWVDSVNSEVPLIRISKDVWAAVAAIKPGRYVKH